MRTSQLFSQTLRETPAEAETTGHQLLLRAGFIRPLAAGIFSYLPLGRKVMDKIEAILRQEIEALGGQEISMPMVHPAELWQESERWYKIGSEMGRFKDKNGRDLALGMTHEEVVADLARREIQSYRQLPRLVYQIQTKWRDDPRPRAGMIRAREFTMKDSYSLDADWEGLDRQYRAHYQAYFNIFNLCDLPVIAVQADVGIMGGSLAHEFIFLTPIGEDTLLLCGNCGYRANRQVARFQKQQPREEAMRPLEKIATPECKTIEALADFLGIPQARTAKAVFLIARIPQGHETGERFVFAIVRGDMEVNETKLANAIHATELRPASESEIRSAGAEPGYASPVGLKATVGEFPPIVVVDDLIPQSPNLVAGANENGHHLRNVNYGRDYQATFVTDIAAAGAGSLCPRCSTPMRAVRGVEVGNIFKLGTDFSEKLGAFFLDRDGQSRPVVMGSYGIGVGRLMACVAEEHHDEHGLVWPVSLAPYQAHLLVLGGRQAGQSESARIGEELYTRLAAASIDCLYDDRDESPGVKFADADLIGLPFRLTVSERSLRAGGIELKRRDSQDRSIVSFEELAPRLVAEIGTMEADIKKKVVQVPYEPDADRND